VLTNPFEVAQAAVQPGASAPTPASNPFCPSCGTPDAGCSPGETYPDCPCVIPDTGYSGPGSGAVVPAGWWSVITTEADNLPATDPENFRSIILNGGVYVDPATGLQVFDVNGVWIADTCGADGGAACDTLILDLEEAEAVYESEGYTIVNAKLVCAPQAGPFLPGPGPGGCPIGEFYSIPNERCFPTIAPWIFIQPNQPPTPPPMQPPGGSPCPGGGPPPCVGHLDPPLPLASDGIGFSSPSNVALPVHPTIHPDKLRGICGECDSASWAVDALEEEMPT